MGMNINYHIWQDPAKIEIVDGHTGVLGLQIGVLYQSDITIYASPEQLREIADKINWYLGQQGAPAEIEVSGRDIAYVNGRMYDEVTK